MKVMIVAGEASGDMHGANLARQLQAIDPRVRLFGMGGKLMAQAGVRLLFNPTTMSTIGFVEALRSVQVLRRVLLKLGDIMDRQEPDVLVVIDFPGFNMRLAGVAKRKDVPVVYYFSPSAWAWGKGRAEKVAETCTKVCSVFPFEYDVYKAAGADVTFVGHPLLDSVRPSMAREEAQAEFGLNPDQPTFALLPGSREQEIRSLLPVMADAGALIGQEVSGAQFVLPLAHTISESEVKDLTEGKIPVHVSEGHVYDVLNVADVAIVACGTATLEAALMGTPLVAVYRVSASTYMIGKALLKIPYVALPNIVAGREVIPELLQNDVKADKVAQAVLALWNDPERLETVRKDFAAIQAKLGTPGAVRRVAEVVYGVGERRETPSESPPEVENGDR